MSKVKIISDSTCDLSEELLAQFDVAVLPHPIVRDGELLQDNVTITPDDIYRHYEQTGRLCTTSAPNAYDYEMCWKPWLDEGYEIVHFTISSEMSTAYNQAMLAAEESAVLANARTAILLAPPAQPQLKQNQPIHSMEAPSRNSGMLCGW